MKLLARRILFRGFPAEAFVQSAEPTCYRFLRNLTLVLVLGFVRSTHGADDFTLRIIALNDFHGNLESPGKFQEKANATAVPAGGIDALATRIKELKAGHPNNVVVAAGDLIGASPLSSALFHDEGTIETLNRMGLEISSVGNHEFDKGIDELLRMQNGGCSKQDEHTCQGARMGTSVPFQGAKFRYLAANVYDRYVKLAEPIQNTVVGAIKHTITRKADPAKIQSKKDPGEAALGDLIADAQLEYTRLSGRVDVAFMNPGGIRTDLPFASGVPGIEEGKVTYGELFRIQPFGNSLTTLTMTGAQINRLLEQQFQGCDLDFPEGISAPDQNRILQVSKGFTYQWNPEGDKCNKVAKSSIKIADQAIVDEREYRVTVNSFLAGGGDKFYEFTRGTKPIGGGQDLEALTDYFKKHPIVDDIRLDRIGIAGAPNP